MDCSYGIKLELGMKFVSITCMYTATFKILVHLRLEEFSPDFRETHCIVLSITVCCQGVNQNGKVEKGNIFETFGGLYIGTTPPPPSNMGMILHRFSS